MLLNKFFKPVWIVPVLLMAMLLVLVVTNQVNAHPGDPEPGIIHACVDSHGNLVIVDSPADDGGKGDKDDDGCKKNELALDWSATGEQGLQGLPGPKGDSGTSSWVDGNGIVTTASDVGIGTVNPDGILDVTTGGGKVLVISSNNAPDLRLVSNNGDGGQIEWRNAGAARHYNIDQNGETLRFFTENSVDGAGAIRMELSEPGVLTVHGSIVIGSDSRLKTNIESIADPLDKVLALRGVTFEWNQDLGLDDGTQIGLIAQEVESVLPELVVTGSDGYKSVAYANLVAVLVEAIGELEARVAELENR